MFSDGKWLKPELGLYEQGVADDSIFLYRQRYYMGKVAEEDAFTIHVLYLQVSSCSETDFNLLVFLRNYQRRS